MIDWIKATHGVVASVPAVFSTMVACCNLGLLRLVFSPDPAPIHRRVEALEQFNRDARLLVLDRRLVARRSARHALAGNACVFG
jgi:hypothetical protein